MQENEGANLRPTEKIIKQRLLKYYEKCTVQNNSASRLCFWDVKNRPKPDTKKPSPPPSPQIWEIQRFGVSTTLYFKGIVRPYDEGNKL
jgi:hypothetical protein